MTWFYRWTVRSNERVGFIYIGEAVEVPQVDRPALAGIVSYLINHKVDAKEDRVPPIGAT